VFQISCTPGKPLACLGQYGRENFYFLLLGYTKFPYTKNEFFTGKHLKATRVLKTENKTDDPVPARLLTDRLGGDPRYLHAPLIVENEIVRKTLLQTRNIQETLTRAEQADVALVGIGCPNSELYSLKRAGYVDEAETQHIRAAGVVGDICGHHYSLTGEWLDIDINHRTVGVSLETLSNIDMVIGVAAAHAKGRPYSVPCAVII